VANSLTTNVSAFAVDGKTGALKPVPGSPFQTGMTPLWITISPSGKNVYVADWLGGISGYSVGRTSGALTPLDGSPFETGNAPKAVSVDPSGKFAYVANGGDNTVTAYDIDTNGALLFLKKK
jgi:DNA-binding beta-propeller fold protein YncE